MSIFHNFISNVFILLCNVVILISNFYHFLSIISILISNIYIFISNVVILISIFIISSPFLISKPFFSYPDGTNVMLDAVRRRQIDRHNELLREYQKHVTFLSDYHGRSFRPSTSKKDENLQFVAVNLHLQELIVVDGESQTRT